MPVELLLEPNVENLRAEIARYQIEQRAIANVSELHEASLSHYLVGRRPLTQQAAERIARAINTLLGTEIFSLELRDV